jgi:hypothetical protein
MLVAIAACVLAGLIAVGVVYGPKLWSVGRDVIGPIRELSRSDEALEQLNQSLAWEPPADGLVSEDRLQVMLEVHADLEPRYRRWREVVEKIEAEQGESLDAAKTVLAETRDVMQAQVEVLETHQMSGPELVWLEDIVYATWLRTLESSADVGARPAQLQRLRELTEQDLAALDELEARYSASALSRAMRQRLEDRLAGLDEARPPEVEGVPEATQQLLWRYRDEIMRLDLGEYRQIHHDRFRSSSGVKVTVGEEEP